jgi:hypothetical protein
MSVKIVQGLSHISEDIVWHVEAVSTETITIDVECDTEADAIKFCNENNIMYEIEKLLKTGKE